MANNKISRESTIRKFADLLGNTEASFEAVQYGRLYY